MIFKKVSRVITIFDTENKNNKNKNCLNLSKHYSK